MQDKVAVGVTWRTCSTRPSRAFRPSTSPCTHQVPLVQDKVTTMHDKVAVMHDKVAVMQDKVTVVQDKVPVV